MRYRTIAEILAAASEAAEAPGAPKPQDRGERQLAYVEALLRRAQGAACNAGADPAVVVDALAGSLVERAVELRGRAGAAALLRGLAGWVEQGAPDEAGGRTLH